jgi:Sec-independent protein translocase protein TatA
MEFLGVGPMELAFILIIALIILGPKDMAKASKQIGTFMRKVVTSDTWKAVKTTSRELQALPNRLMRESGMDEEVKNLDNITRSMKVDDLTSQNRTIHAPRSVGSNSPQPVLSGPEVVQTPSVEPPAPETPSQPTTPPSDLHN